jgi:uncharacterized phage infection (PIP) family protein YhgE
VNNETASQSVLGVEVPNLQIDSSDKDKNSTGDETPSSEITIVTNMMQELLQRSDQQSQELKEGQKQAREEMTDLREGQKQLKEGLQKDFNQVLLECRKSRDLLKQELSEKSSAEVGKVTFDLNQEKGDISNAETTNAVVAVREDVNAIQERFSKVEGISHDLVHLNSSVPQI